MRPLGKRAVVGAIATAALVVPLLDAGTADAVRTNDQFAGELWNLDQVRAPGAWETTTGAGVVVAVVDSGVDLDHPDLAGRLVRGVTTVGCGREQRTCGNGDWVGTDRRGQQLDRHGTHVSGTVAAAAGNGIGVAGVAPDAKVMPVKALEDGSGSTRDIAAGIRWAVRHGADVINMSLGGAPGTELLTVVGLDARWMRAVDLAVRRGVLVVAAAGNETYPFCSSPANVPGVLCVTATVRDESPASYSNIGLRPDLSGDTVAAPGGAAVVSCADDVLSTVPVGTGRGECGNRDYDSMAGTSMAAPAVAGVAALLFSQCRTRDNVLAAIKQSARNPLGGLPVTPWYGAGIVDARAAVASRGARC